MNAVRSILRFVARHRVLSLFLLIVVISAFFIFRFISERSQGILSAPLKRAPIVESVYGIGTVTANRSFQLKPGVVSTINDLYVKEGDGVNKGQSLARVDQVLFRAPFTGTVTALPFKTGENVFAQVPLLTLVDLTDRYLLVSLEQQGALRVRRGQTARMSFDTIREQTYRGTVEAVYSNDSTFLARIDLKNLPRNILPGMTCDVAIAIREQPSALLVPVAALEQGRFIWVKRGRSVPSRHEITTGIIDKDMAEVISGDLREGDRVLIREKAGA